MELREKAQLAAKPLNRMRLAIALAEIHDDHPYIAWGYSSFFVYTTGELKITRRFAQLLTGTGRYVRNVLGSSEAKMEAVTWENARKMIAEARARTQADAQARVRSRSGDVQSIA